MFVIVMTPKQLAATGAALSSQLELQKLAQGDEDFIKQSQEALDSIYKTMKVASQVLGEQK